MKILAHQTSPARRHELRHGRLLVAPPAAVWCTREFVVRGSWKESSRDSDLTRDIQTVFRQRVVRADAAWHGLVIGIEDHQDSRLNLRCARADAQAVYDLMVDPECGMFAKGLILNFQTGTNRNARFHRSCPIR